MKEKLLSLLQEWFDNNPSDYLYWYPDKETVQLDGEYKLDELASFIEEKLK